MVNEVFKTEAEIQSMLEGMQDAVRLAQIPQLRGGMAVLILMQAVSLIELTSPTGADVAMKIKTAVAPAQPREGWGLPGTIRKAHYYVHDVALCRQRRPYRGLLVKGRSDSPDSCAECQKRLSNRTASNRGVGH